MLNISLFEKINGWANHGKILDWIGIFFADYLLWIAVGILIILFLIKKTRLTSIVAGLSVVLARLVITEVIKYFYHSVRPYLVLDNVRKLIAENKNFQSFPSGHTAIFFAIAMAIFYFNRKWGIIAFVVAVLVGLSRIYVGVHWPIDILAGALIGIISGIVINYGFKIKNQSN